MARVHRVATSRKEHTCGAGGGHTIPAGEPYSWAKPGFRRRTPLIRCANHPFRPSELTTSQAAAPMAAQEAFDDALADIDQTAAEALDELATAVEELQSAVRDYADERQAALDAWEYGNSTLEELNDTAQAAADEAESFEVEEWDGDTDLRDDEVENYPEPDEDHPRYDEWADKVEAIEEAKQSWQDHVTAQFEAAAEMSAGLEF